MGQMPKSSKPASVSTRLPITRRSLLEVGANAGMVTAAAGCGAALRPGFAKAAGPTPADRSARQLSVFRMRQGAAQVYLDEAAPVHTSNEALIPASIYPHRFILG